MIPRPERKKAHWERIDAMTPGLPFFLRRSWWLFKAHRALSEGSAEHALACLRHPSLSVSSRADDLRRRAMDVLYRIAAERARQGRDGSVARLIRVAAEDDPERAVLWSRRLGGPAPDAPDPKQDDLRRLLAEMRSGSGAAPPAHEPRVPAKHGAPAPGGTRARTEALRFHLAVDDGGEFLVVCSASVTLGHARAGRADVPFLADIESRHARLVREESFHHGPTWRVEPVESAHVEVGDRPLSAPELLTDGDVVRLAPNLAFRFRLPEPSSTSAVLELFHGAESEGAVRVLLLAPGPSGRVRIGPRRLRHVPVAGLEHEVELSLVENALKIVCEGGVRVLGVDAADEAAIEKCVPFPPTRRYDVSVNARPSQRPPFCLAIDPIESGDSADSVDSAGSGDSGGDRGGDAGAPGLPPERPGGPGASR